jgi:hypothetical protein
MQRHERPRFAGDDSQLNQQPIVICWGNSRFASPKERPDMNKQITKVWTFTSDSNPNLEYETLQYTDGSTSCNCMGWTRRVASDGTRSCKHTRAVDMGIANNNCRATHSYEPQQPSNQHQQQQQQVHHAKNQQRQVFQIPKLGHRKFAI